MFKVRQEADRLRHGRELVVAEITAHPIRTIVGRGRVRPTSIGFKPRRRSAQRVRYGGTGWQASGMRTSW